MIKIADNPKMAVIVNNEKQCSKCRHIKKLNEFCRSKNTKDGRHNCCKKCENLRQKQNRMQNPGKYREYQNKRRASYKTTNPEKYQLWINHNAIWRNNNPDKIKQYANTYYEKHRNVILQNYINNRNLKIPR